MGEFSIVFIGLSMICMVFFSFSMVVFKFFQEIWENCVLYNDYDSDLKRENCFLMMVLLQKNVFY